MTWRLVSYIGNPQARSTAAYLPALAMLFGLTLSFFLMISQRLARLAIERSRHLAAANGQLEESLQRQLRMQALNQRIMQFSLDVLCSVDAQGRFSELSPSCEAVLGYKPEELIGRPFIDFVLADDRQRTQEEAAAIMAGRATRTFRNRYRHRDGRTVHILWSADWSEEEQRLFAVAHDISPLVQNESFAAEQQDILGMISTDRRLSEILTAICLMVEVREPKALCSVLLTDTAGQHLLTGAAPSLPKAYSQAIHGMAIGPKAGSSGTAAFRRQLVVVEDIHQSPLWEDYRSLALEHGLRACYALPLHSHQGAVLGTFAMYQRQAQAPNDEQLKLLSTAGQLAAIAIERAHDRLRLQESEQRFRSLFTFNPDSVFSFDLGGRFQSMNAAGMQLTGFSEAELLGRRFVDVVVDEELPRVEAHFAAACAGEPQRYELRARDRQNNQLTLDVTNLPIMVDQRIIGVFGVAKDVSAERRAGQALRERQQFFKLSLEMFCMVDLRGHFIQVNPAFAEVLRYPTEVLIGYSYLELIHPDDQARVEVAIRQLQRGELIQDLAIRVLDATSQQRWLELSAALGEDRVIYCVARDISERRRTEQELQATLLELERSNLELQEFAFVASHDLQEPLRKIQAFSERLATRSASLDVETLDYLQRMSSAAARMQALIIDLLDYSRVNSRGQPFKRLQLTELLSEVLEDMESTLERTHAQVDYPQLPTIMGDATQLRQVLQNLISNAVKFQAPGNRPVIRIYTEHEDVGSWSLCVADNGIGFDEKYLDRIFNPFQRLHSRQAYAGTGIGLAVVKKIVERHGARIDAVSSLGKGSVFRITFPLSARVFE